MEFARNILKKYGWEEGKGLGKKEDGIDKALKPKLKFDTTGLGHDPGEQFTNKWWESAYNSAANNIDVKNKKSKVKIKKNGDIEISTKKKMHWKKESVEQIEEETAVNNEASCTQEPLSGVVHLTDEELFAACGGLTGHKAARHGHKLSGKLKRLQEQEEELGSSLIEVDVKKRRKHSVKLEEACVSSERNTTKINKPQKDTKSGSQIIDSCQENTLSDMTKKKKKSKTNNKK